MGSPQKSSQSSSQKGAQDISAEQLKTLYREMLLIRRFEERAGQLYGRGEIAGFCHLYIGQEAVVTGIQSVLTPEDTVLTTYRDHGHMLACGMDPKGVMAELVGKETGYSKGKGGSMHMFSREANFLGGHGIVGAHVPLGTGVALYHQYKKTGGICATYMGDGAVNQGQVYEAFNMAALWNLPVLYVIENNHYGMGTSTARACANHGELFRRGEPYGIPGKAVDGMDVLKVREAAQEAVSAIRAGKGPQLLEVRTYRYRGHSMSDPGTYRSKDEVESYRKDNDPLLHAATLLNNKGIGEDELKALDKEIKAIVLEAATFAQESAEPDASELYTDILIETSKA